jgi:peptidoglycan/LPS O-acetylase OafA/YrhL
MLNASHGSAEVASTMTRSIPAYRPDIDGLRAIAVISVVAYHLFPSAASGGFVGVDVFFVLSGYLISGIILRGLALNKFTYADFYIRRIKRIFPALVLILLFCLLAGQLLLFIDEYKQLGKYVAAGAGFFSNFLLLREGGYFDAAAELKPLLHLWSLGIEEQYYLVWPLFIGLFWRRPRLLVGAIVATAILSFGANLWLVGSYADWAFYLPITRFWELMIGAVLASIALRLSLDATTRNDSEAAVFRVGTCPDWMRDALSLSGIILIVVSVFAFDKSLHYPGAWALAPSLGTALILVGGPSAWLNRALLARREAVFIGLISYPLYLWHWPILYFARIVAEGEPSLAAKLAIIVVSIVLSALTFRYVETPIRTSSVRFGPALAKGLCAAIAAQMVVGVMAYKTWIPLRIPAEWQAIAHARDDKYGPRSWDESRKIKPYYMGDLNRADIMFFGDSHMENYYPRIRDLLADGRVKDIGIAFVTAGGCAPFPGVERVDQDPPSGCSDFFAQALEFARQKKFRKVVFGAYWDRYFIGVFEGKAPAPLLYLIDDKTKSAIYANSAAYDNLFLGLESTFMALQADGTQIFVVLPSPAADIFAPTHILQRFSRIAFTKEDKPLVESLDTAALRNFNRPVTAAFERLRDRYGVILIDPVDSICEPERCFNMRDGKPFNSDRDHLASEYIRFHATYIDRVFGD